MDTPTRIRRIVSGICARLARCEQEHRDGGDCRCRLVDGRCPREWEHAGGQGRQRGWLARRLAPPPYGLDEEQFVDPDVLAWKRSRR